MSLDPVLAITAVASRSVQPNDFPDRAAPVKARPRPVPPDSGLAPNRESQAPRKATKSFELPRDEVQVQRDAQNQIVIQYLDGSGKVIFQVPSSQILALQQAIEQALEQQEQSRASRTSGAEDR